MKFVRVALEININKLLTYSVPEELEHLLSPGVRVKVPLGKRLITGFIIDFEGEDVPGGVKPVSRAVEDFPVMSPRMSSLARRLAEYYVAPEGEIIKSMLPGKAKLKREKPAESNVLVPAGLSGWLEPVRECFYKNSGGVFVLDGIFSRGEPSSLPALVAECVNSGRQAVVLFPDTASLLRHESEFGALMPGLYGIYHGSLDAKTKRSVWEGALSGRLRAVLGLRSAVFAPFRRLGLIIVHDEADFSYKSRRYPRINARDAALMRGEEEGCPVVLGGDFPSFETFRSVQTAEFNLLKPERPEAVCGPAVRIVDMRFERARIFSRSLKQAVFSALDEKRQVLLFLNRRGYSNYFVCRGCGFLKRCKNCSVCLRYHADSGRLRCHYCDYSEQIDEVCPSCKKNYFRKSGFGSQQAEAMAGKIFKGARIARMDSDIAPAECGPGGILEKFARGGIDVLIDTGAAVNSGVFENVSVCGIMSADNFLNMPDFRAAENFFRFASRARSCVNNDAALVIQTYNPGHYAMDCIKIFDRGGFYARESVMRKKLGYPPFARICNIIISGGQRKIVEASADRFAALLERELSGGEEVLGPVPAVVSRIKNKHRFQIVLKSPGWDETSKKLGLLLERAREERIFGPGVRASADVDPVNMF